MAQQITVMKQQGVANPQPQKAWLHNLAPKLNEWVQEGEVLLMVDANSGLDNKDFAPFVAETGMCDIIGRKHGVDIQTHMLK
eukprot:12873090-Ditylum_brightwellii.AAC.1